MASADATTDTPADVLAEAIDNLEAQLTMLRNNIPSVGNDEEAWDEASALCSRVEEAAERLASKANDAYHALVAE